MPAACDSEAKSRRSDRGGSRTNLGPALETGQPWPPPSIGHPPVSSPTRPPSPSFFSKRSALFPSDCVHGDHLWSPRGLLSARCTPRPKTLSRLKELTDPNQPTRPASWSLNRSSLKRSTRAQSGKNNITSGFKGIRCLDQNIWSRVPGTSVS